MSVAGRVPKCDMCGKRYCGAPTEWSSSHPGLQEIMQEDDWQRRWGLDICPACSERIAVEAKEKP